MPRSPSKRSAKRVSKVNQRAMKEGLANVYWPGRFQRVGERMILDGAHNPAASKRLIETWRNASGEQRATIIFGGLRDKDLEGMVSTLSTIGGAFLNRSDTKPASRFTLPKSNLSCRNTSQPTQCDSAAQALDLAYHFNDPILVTGSLFLVGEFLAILQPSQGVLQTSNQ